MTDLIKALEEAEKERRPSDNALDVLVEVALFEPCEAYSAVRPNNAGTKLIYTRTDGSRETCLAWDWTQPSNRRKTIALLKAASDEGAER